jgi:hypothetical protein
MIGPMRSFILSGAVAGAIGTVAMDLVWYARDDGDSSFPDWEVTRDVTSWDDAPAPGRMGRKIVQTVTGRDVPVERAAALSNFMHWTYGTAWTVAYAAVARRRGLWAGPAFGAAVWASDYVTLPLAGVYEPIWKYDPHTLWQDLSAHLVFGTAADAALRLLGH